MDTENNPAPRLALRQAFDTPWPGPRGDTIRLKKGPINLELYPDDGCRITSLTAFGYELLRQWRPARRAFQYGCFPMVPWIGRLGNGLLKVEDQTFSLPVNKPPHALHGMACYSDWQVESVTPENVVCRMTLSDPWPWEGYVIQRLQLEEDGLRAALEIHSLGERFPAAAGWHPWFAKWTGDTSQVALAQPGKDVEKLQINFAADWQEEPGENELPTGKRIAPRPGPWDDCFGFEQAMSAQLIWPGKIRLSMSSPATSMIVFDKQPDAACVEPLTQQPNGLNTHPQWVTPENPLRIETHWRIELDEA